MVTTIGEAIEQVIKDGNTVSFKPSATVFLGTEVVCSCYVYNLEGADRDIKYSMHVSELVKDKYVINAYITVILQCYKSVQEKKKELIS